MLRKFEVSAKVFGIARPATTVLIKESPFEAVLMTYIYQFCSPDLVSEFSNRSSAWVGAVKEHSPILSRASDSHNNAIKSFINTE